MENTKNEHFCENGPYEVDLLYSPALTATATFIRLEREGTSWTSNVVLLSAQCCPGVTEGSRQSGTSKPNRHEPVALTPLAGGTGLTGAQISAIDFSRKDLNVRIRGGGGAYSHPQWAVRGRH